MLILQVSTELLATCYLLLNVAGSITVQIGVVNEPIMPQRLFASNLLQYILPVHLIAFAVPYTLPVPVYIILLDK